MDYFLSCQVQKNCLLALCSDYILQDVPFDKLVHFLSLKTSQMNQRPCGGQDNRCTRGTVVFFQRIEIQLKYFSCQKKLETCSADFQKACLYIIDVFLWECVPDSHSVILVQVFSSYAGDQLAEQPWRSYPSEDGCGCHLYSGGQGQDITHSPCISVLQENRTAPVSPAR